MPSQAWTLKDFQGYVRKLPNALKKAAVKGIQIGGQRALGVVQRAGDQASPASPNGSRGAFDTGAYRRSWRAVNQADGVIVTNIATYADVIERGRRAGRKFPPMRSIERWAARKLGLDAIEAKRAAFPIARAIARRGLRGRKVLSGAIPAVTQVVMAEMRKEVARALRGGQ